MAKTKKKPKVVPAPKGPNRDVPEVPAPTRWIGPRSPLSQVRKPMAPPTRVHGSRKRRKLDEMADKARKEWAEGRTKPMFDEDGNWIEWEDSSR